MKSEHGVPANSRGTKMQISNEEYDLRYDYQSGKLDMTLDEFNARVAEIRKETGKPNLHMGKGLGDVNNTSD